MIFYTLDENFRKKHTIDSFVSAVWTERYTSAGDAQLVVPATTEMIEKLPEGTKLFTPGSREVMLLETRSTEDGLMTLSGSSLVKFLNERWVWIPNTAGDVEPILIVHGYEWNAAAGTAISLTVFYMCIRTDLINSGGTTAIDLVWADESIPNLTLGDEDDSGPLINGFPVPVGPVYDGIAAVAETYHVGISLYLESATDEGYSLKFKTYQGLDRTSTQDDNPLVRFSPALGSLSKVKELRSISGYKNVAYAYAEGFPIQTAYADPFNIPVGFDRRTMVVTLDNLELYDTDLMDQMAKDALVNNNYIKILDGEVIPQSKYKFGTHFFLGDIIELQGRDGLIQKARVTEYIRSHDDAGERAYPTISVID